jgi:hypothetical protein
VARNSNTVRVCRPTLTALSALFARGAPTYATWQHGTLQLGATRRLLLLIHRNLPSRECATVAPGNKREKEHLMLDVVLLALGLGFFLVAVGYAHACERP